MDENTLAYFSSINPLARKIIKDERDIRNALKDRWNELDWHNKEALIDDFIVDNATRERYAGVQKTHTYPKSFPKYKIETGEKIVVDFEKDCWTWQDEHSSPFNWRTKSQQDLTLDDLEPDALYIKTAPKPKKSDSSIDQYTDKIEEKTENREFSVQTGTSIWESPFLQGVKKPDFLNRSRSASPTKSTTASRESLTTSRSKSPEEVNYAFSGSMDDLSSSPSYHDERSASASSGEIRERSPSPSYDAPPSKPARSKRSSSKSPIKNVLSSSKKSDSDTGSQSLVYSNGGEEDLAFDNPALRRDWSPFVNDNEQESSSSATPSPYKSLLKEPEPIGMDRGEQPENQSALLTGYQDDFQEEYLMVEKSIEEDQSKDDLNSSSMSKTGFDFLDNW